MPIIQAVGSAVNADAGDVAQRMEQAMVEAVLRALSEGVAIADTAELLKRKAAVR